jgi:hypothetical protein
VKKAYIAPISWGLGDLIVSLPVVHGLIASGRETILVTRSYLQEGLGERIPGLAGAMKETELGEGLDGEYLNLRAHPIQTEYWWGTAEFEAKYGRLKINNILAVICRDMGLAADFDKLKPLERRECSASKGKVILLPGTDGAYKFWEKSYWLEVAARLQNSGQQVVVIGQPDRCQAVRELCESSLQWVETPGLGDALDAISAAKLVIGVDTGLMHVAVQQGVPTVALYRSDPIYLREYSHVVGLTANSCRTECIGKGSGSTAVGTDEAVRSSAAGGWVCDAVGKDRCMASITPEMVIKAVDGLLLAGCALC